MRFDSQRVFVIVVTMGSSACEEQMRRLLGDSRLLPVLVLNGCPRERVKCFRKLLDGQGHCIELPENLGGSGGFRAGMQYVLDSGCPDSQFVWLLDDDAEINDGTLTELLNAASFLSSRNVRWGAIGSMMLDSNDRSRVVETGAKIIWRKGHCIGNNYTRQMSQIPLEPMPVEYCAAASLLTTAGIIRDIGLFADVFIHCDDMEWCLRLARNGYSVYCAPASYVHHPDFRGSKLSRRWVVYYDVANIIWMTRKYHPWMAWIPLLKSALRGVYLYLHGLRLTSKLCFMGIRDGLKGEKRKLRRELSEERYVEVGTDEWKGPRLFVSPDRQSLELFRSQYPEGTRLFSLEGGLLIRFLKGLALNLQVLFMPGTRIIVEECQLRTHIMPVFFRHCDIYNVFLRKKVES